MVLVRALQVKHSVVLSDSVLVSAWSVGGSAWSAPHLRSQRQKIDSRLMESESIVRAVSASLVGV